MIKKIALIATIFVLSLAPTQAQDLMDMSWDEIVTQAKVEGEINWFQWYLQDGFRDAIKTFEEEYGIKVNVADGALDANMNKLIAESGRTTGDIDVLSTTFGQMSKLDIPEMFIPLTQVEDYDKLITVFEGVDTMGHGIAWWGNQTGIAYDPNRVTQEELPQSFEELTAWMEANPKQFAINDPNGGGAGTAFVVATVRNLAGDPGYFDAELDETKTADWDKAWEWFEAQADNYEITASNADSLTRLNDGEFKMVPAWEDHLAGLQKQGAISSEIAYYIPEFGMNGGANSITIPANAKNKAAALVFVNWLTSAETQSQLNATFGSSPKHPDASDEFALVSNDQRAYSTLWPTAPYSDLIKQIFIDRIIMNR